MFSSSAHLLPLSFYLFEVQYPRFAQIWIAVEAEPISLG